MQQCGARHTGNHGGWFILHESEAAGVSHGEQSIGPVAPHAGHDNADTAGPEHCRRRLKQMVRRRAHPPERRIRIEQQHRDPGLLTNAQMLPAGSDVDVSGDHGQAIDGAGVTRAHQDADFPALFKQCTGQVATDVAGGSGQDYEHGILQGRRRDDGAAPTGERRGTWRAMPLRLAR